MHLVQELNGGTVGFEYFSITFLSIFHYQTFTEWGRLDYEAGCGGGVWLTQVAISQ